MEKLSTYVLIAAIGASLLIVSLVVLLFLRDRKHEFGVYLSLGEKRARVIGQIIFEVITIAILALGLSVFSGNMLASSLSNSMVQSQIEAQMEKESNEMGTMFLSDPGEKTKVTEEDVSEAYKVNLTPSYLITFFSLGIGTILGATIVPMGYLMRLNPKKIML
jgi:putative ABC transport system permease protein